MTGIRDERSVWTDEICRRAAAFHHGAIYGDDEPGGGHPDGFIWTYDPALPVAQTIDGLGPADRADWMRCEVAADDADGGARGYRAMVGETIEEPVIIVRTAGALYCWDGNHRIGACCLGNVTTLPAVIGTPREAVKDDILPL